MNRKYLVLIVIVLLAAAAALAYFIIGYQQKPASVVNGQVISEEQVQKAIAERASVHHGTGAKVSPEALRASVMEQLISEALIYQGAEEAGINVDDGEVQVALDSMKARTGEEAYRKYLADSGYTELQYSKMLKERMVKDRFVNQVIFNGNIPEEDLRAFYKESPVPFLAPEMVELRIVELATEQEALDALKEMRSQKDGFDKVAEKLRDNQTAFVSDYGETSPSYYPGEIGRAMKELETGAFGGPYKGRDGYFVIRVRDRKSERPKTFEEARDEIKAMLYERRKSAALGHWLADRKNSSSIVRN